MIARFKAEVYCEHPYCGAGAPATIEVAHTAWLRDAGATVRFIQFPPGHASCVGWIAGREKSNGKHRVFCARHRPELFHVYYELVDEGLK